MDYLIEKIYKAISLHNVSYFSAYQQHSEASVH